MVDFVSGVTRDRSQIAGVNVHRARQRVGKSSAHAQRGSVLDLVVMEKDRIGSVGGTLEVRRRTDRQPSMRIEAARQKPRSEGWRHEVAELQGTVAPIVVNVEDALDESIGVPGLDVRAGNDTVEPAPDVES